MFPVFSEAITGEKQTIGIPFFNAVTIPMFLGILLLMGVGPMVAWRKANLSRLARQFAAPAAGALSIAALLLWVGVRGLYPILSYSLCWFVTITILADLHRIGRSRGKQDGGYLRGVTSGVVQQKSKYAGHLVHFGVVVAAVSITASTAHKIEREFVLHPGERLEVGSYSLELQEVVPRMEPNFHSLGAVVLARQLGTGAHVAVLRPEMRRYLRNNETTSEVALHMGWRDDLYLVVAGYDDGGQTMAFKVFVNPLQIWLWIGVGIMALGTLCSVWPQRKPRRAIEGVSEKIYFEHALVRGA
jgi:cytochrome c-type biogenesis protein CcmF